jgi:hypothetical protein
MAREFGIVRVVFWDDEKASSWPNHIRLVALYLLTGKHTNLIGCFKATALSIQGACQLKAEPNLLHGDPEHAALSAMQDALEFLERERFIVRCKKTGWIWVRNYMRHNPLASTFTAGLALKQGAAVPSDASFFTDFREAFTNDPHWERYKIKPSDARKAAGNCDFLRSGPPLRRRAPAPRREGGDGEKSREKMGEEETPSPGLTPESLPGESTPPPEGRAHAREPSAPPSARVQKSLRENRPPRPIATSPHAAQGLAIVHEFERIRTEKLAAPPREKFHYKDLPLATAWAEDGITVADARMIFDTGFPDEAPERAGLSWFKRAADEFLDARKRGAAPPSGPKERHATGARDHTGAALFGVQRGKEFTQDDFRRYYLPLREWLTNGVWSDKLGDKHGEFSKSVPPALVEHVRKLVKPSEGTA